MAFSTILWIIGILCAIWVIYDVLAKKPGMSIGKKVIWIVAALLFSIITAIIYYLIEKK